MYDMDSLSLVTNTLMFCAQLVGRNLLECPCHHTEKHHSVWFMTEGKRLLNHIARSVSITHASNRPRLSNQKIADARHPNDQAAL